MALLLLSTSVSQSPGILGVWALAGEGGSMTLEGNFLEEMVLESGLEAG